MNFSITKDNTLFYFLVFGHIEWYSGVTPGSIFTNHSCRCSGDCMGCKETYARQMSCLMYYHSRPKRQYWLMVIWSTWLSAAKIFSLDTRKVTWYFLSGWSSPDWMGEYQKGAGGRRNPETVNSKKLFFP